MSIAIRGYFCGYQIATIEFMDKRTIRELNLKYAAHVAGGISELSTKANCSQKYLEQILQGFQGAKDKNPRKLGDIIAKRITDFLREDFYWIDLPHPELWEQIGEEPPIKAAAKKPSGTFEISRYNRTGSMGHGHAVDEYEEVIEKITVTAEWIKSYAKGRNPKNLALISAKGDSMEPTFNNGDILIIDRSVVEVDAEAIYVLTIGNDLHIKRLQRWTNGSTLMISDNKKYKERKLTAKDQVVIHGMVVHGWNARSF